MDSIIPTRKIRIKQNEKKLIEDNRNPNRLEKQKIFFEDTSSDYNPNFIYFPTNDIPLFDIKKIRAFREKKINEMANSYKGTDLSLSQKRLKILDEMNTSSDSDEDRINDVSISDFDYDEASTYCSSYSSFSQPDEKVKYWIEFKLYDNIVDYNNKKNIKLPKLIQLNEDKYYYLYLNKLKTYYYIKSAFLGSNKSINKDLDESKLNESLGLFFCGKNIEYNNENIICSPNNMICKNCMEKNRIRYNLKDKYLININGRVAKKTKNKDEGFHCFGHFLIGKIQIENCLNKFCCEACKLLNKYEKYYYS
jgi:hypothetical protein